MKSILIIHTPFDSFSPIFDGQCLISFSFDYKYYIINYKDGRFLLLVGQKLIGLHHRLPQHPHDPNLGLLRNKILQRYSLQTQEKSDNHIRRHMAVDCQ